VGAAWEVEKHGQERGVRSEGQGEKHHGAVWDAKQHKKCTWKIFHPVSPGALWMSGFPMISGLGKFATFSKVSQLKAGLLCTGWKIFQAQSPGALWMSGFPMIFELGKFSTFSKAGQPKAGWHAGWTTSRRMGTHPHD
jgi:hypothetical protein